MTEYWVSQSKFHCKYCNFWIPDTKFSKEQHDNTPKHKQKLAQFLKNQRNEKLHGMRNERELQQVMRDINKAANQAIAQDRNDLSSSGIKFSMNTNNTAKPQFRGNFNQRNIPQPEEDKSKLLREDSSGMYTIRGITYLEGQFHEDKLVSGIQCQIYNEEMDDWFDATIKNRKDIIVPNTELKLKFFTISYFIKNDETNENNTEEIIEESVKSDRLRIPITENNKDLLGTNENSLVDNNKVDSENPKVDEMTGIGRWQTVSVKLIDEEKEKELEEQRRIQEEEERIENEKQKKLEQMKLYELNSDFGADNALSSYDPYGKNIYRGIAIKSDDDNSNINNGNNGNISMNGKKIEFKKRKISDSQNNSQRKKVDFDDS